MRVLAITPWFPNAIHPGSGVFNLRDVELLAQDHVIDVIHLCQPSLLDPHPSAQVSEQITVHQVPFSLTKPGAVRDAISTIRRLASGMDVVHTMAFPALFPVARAQLRMPWIHTEHWTGLVMPPPSLRAQIGGRFLRADLARPDAVVAVGTLLAESITRHRPQGCTVVNNFVRFAPPGKLPERPEQRGDLPLRLIGVGGLIERKGPVLAVQVLAALHRRGVFATLEWAGTGEQESIMLDSARELGVSDQVRLLGHIEPPALSERLLDAHLLIAPTAMETFGVAIAEALGHGLPVVATGVGGHLDFLPSEAARVVAERQEDCLADAVVALTSDPDRWSPADILKYAQGTFSEEARRLAYRGLYQEIVDRKH